jgi:hypothetical protein
MRASQMALLFCILESNMPHVPSVDEDDMPAEIKDREETMRRIEAYAHSEGRYDFASQLVPAARIALKRIGFA